LLSTCYRHAGPASVRYPRGAGCGAAVSTDLADVPVGKAVVRRQGHGVAILAFGTLAVPGLAAAQTLDATLVDMRFVKPLDTALLDHRGRCYSRIPRMQKKEDE